MRTPALSSRSLLSFALGKAAALEEPTEMVAGALIEQGLAVVALDRPVLEAGLAVRLRQERVRLAALHAFRAKVLEEVRAVAGARPVVALKGLAYGAWLYPSPEHRPMGDIDLLLRAEDRDAVFDALIARGFRSADGPRPSSHRERSVFRGPVRLELHHSLAVDPRFSFDTETLLSRAGPCPGLEGFLSLDLPDAVAYHAVHQAMHHYTLPLIGWVDLARLLGRIQALGRYHELWDRAGGLGARRALSASVFALRRLDLLEDLSFLPAPIGARLVSRVAIDADGPPPDRHAEPRAFVRGALKLGLADDLPALLRALLGLLRVRVLRPFRRPGSLLHHLASPLPPFRA